MLTQVPSRGSLVPKMKDGVFGIGLKEVVYLDGETAEVCTVYVICIVIVTNKSDIFLDVPFPFPFP